MTNQYHTKKNINAGYIFKLLNYIIQNPSLNPDPINFQGPQNIPLSCEIFVC